MMDIRDYQPIDLARAYGDLRLTQTALEKVVDGYDFTGAGEEDALRAALVVLDRNLGQLGAAIRKAVLS